VVQSVKIGGYVHVAAYDGSRFPISLNFLNYGIFIAGSPLFEELPYAIVCILLIVLLIKAAYGESIY